MFIAAALITNYWPLWLVWVLLFGVIEASALYMRKIVPDYNNNGGTLSELVWWLIRGSAWWHRAIFYLLLAGFIDLGLHFFVGTSLA